MSATATQTIHLIDCPACGKAIEMVATYDVRLNASADVSATEKIVTATLTMTGARVHHECPPPKPLSLSNPLPRGGVITTHHPVTRED